MAGSSSAIGTSACAYAMPDASSSEGQPLPFPVMGGELCVCMPCLRELDLSTNNVGSSNFEYLQGIFNQNIKIELLNLDDCRIDEKQVEKLCT